MTHSPYYSSELKFVAADRPGDHELIPQSQSEFIVRHFASGQIIAATDGTSNDLSIVTMGTVIVIQNGMMVDVIESGEFLDMILYQNALVIAGTDCHLVQIDVEQPSTQCIHSDLNVNEETVDLVVDLEETVLEQLEEIAEELMLPEHPHRFWDPVLQSVPLALRLN